MAEITQEDFYKGIFIERVLQDISNFTMQNIAGQSSDKIPSINGTPYPDFLVSLKEQSEVFATAMTAQQP